ncbi:Uncharacterised protein [Mycobacteroides abscessus]|nr:Uncharacterised protein [Mycobacteroides abscessus]
MALGREVRGDGEDPGVVVPQPEPGRQHARVGVVELHAQRPADVADGDRGVEPAVLDPQVVEHAQRAAREVPELGVVALRFQLGDDDDREDHVVLGEPPDGARVAQQDRRVDDERAARAVRCVVLRCG